MSKIIPIVHMFNNDYVVPAAVAFYSLLENANRNFYYKLYVVHSDITENNVIKLKTLVNKFSNAELEFINLENKFADLFSQTAVHAHFSKEIYYKYLVPDIFPQYDKAIVSDVDVLYQGDISIPFEFLQTDENYYIASCRGLNTTNQKTYKERYDKYFSDEEIKNLRFLGGFYVQNLKKMRDNNIPNKLIEYTYTNSQRIRMPEQDVINLVCAGKIKELPINTLICAQNYEQYKAEEDYNKNEFYSAKEIKYALAHPIQLHFAGKNKPWKIFDSTKSELFFTYLAKTEFFKNVMNNIIKKPSYYKQLLKINSKYFKNNLVVSLQSKT